MITGLAVLTVSLALLGKAKDYTSYVRSSNHTKRISIGDFLHAGDPSYGTWTVYGFSGVGNSIETELTAHLGRPVSISQVPIISPESSTSSIIRVLTFSDPAGRDIVLYRTPAFEGEVSRDDLWIRETGFWVRLKRGLGRAFGASAQPS